MTRAAVSLIDKMQFMVKTESGHSFLVDGAPEVGGQNAGARPMELMVASIAGCTAMDVLAILKKMQQEITNLNVSVVGERASDHPKNFLSVHVEYSVTGFDLDETRVEKAISLSEKKYCSAIASMHPSIKLTSNYKIFEQPS